MALKILKSLDTGIDVEYWRIKNIVFDTDTRSTVYLFGYLNEQARIDGKKEVDQISFSIDIDVKNYDKKIIDECYKKLKEKDYFEGAEDV